jgi:hypothetical protein
MGRYLNHSDQEERLRALLEIVPSGSKVTKTQTKKQVHRRLRPAQIEELATGYQAGSTVYQLAKHFRINRETVSKLLEREGLPRRQRPLSPAQIERATELYASGQSLVGVGKQIGCDGGTVRLALIKAGVQMRDCQGRKR